MSGGTISKKIWISFLGILVALTIANCATVEDKGWQGSAIESKNCNISAAGRNVDCGSAAPNVEFKISYLEYADGSGTKAAGAEWNYKQLKSILEQIKAESINGPLLLVVYVHGWHHNSESSDDNLLKFPNMLARYKYGLAQYDGKQKYTVFGIYVGWRGEERTGISKYFTIGNRAKAADEIGGYRSAIEPNIASDLRKISEEMRNGNAESRMIVSGHSLGGRLLSRAFIPDILHGIAQPLGSKTIITTFNAAIGADSYRKLYTAPLLSATPHVPTWVNFTAKEDNATGFIYPLALKLSWLTKLVPDTKDKSADTKKTIGHYTPYITHLLSITNCVAQRCGHTNDVQSIASDSYWRMDDYKLFSMTYAAGTKEQITHCALFVKYPRSRALDQQIKSENPNLCSDVYEKDFDSEEQFEPRIGVPAHGRMWNVLADESVFDFSRPSGLFEFSVHNGYIQTDLVTMLLRLVFDTNLDAEVN